MTAFPASAAPAPPTVPSPPRDPSRAPRTDQAPHTSSAASTSPAVSPAVSPAASVVVPSASASASASGASASSGVSGASRTERACVAELRLSAFAGHRRVRLPFGPLTLLAGPSGSGKTGALRAYEALARLAGGASLDEVFPDPAACVPEDARPDGQGRRGFRIGCTADGPLGPVRLDVAVQAEPELRVVGERLSAGGPVLLETALRDPARRTVEASWYTGGPAAVTRAALPDDRLGTALLPLRVAGRTEGQRQVLAAAEQMVVALRSVFVCAPRPERMRAPAPVDAGRLTRGCDNLAAVLWRTRAECGRRHALLVEAVRAGCAGPVTDVYAEPAGEGRVRAVLDRGNGTRTGFERLGDGELRYAALALVLLTGPGVLEVDSAGEVPEALQTLTVLVDGLDVGLDPRQRAALLGLAGRMCERGHIRLAGAVSDGTWTGEEPAARVVDLVR
ncbi:AAA family ATPase [Streptomyces seoulensis]